MTPLQEKIMTASLSVMLNHIEQEARNLVFYEQEQMKILTALQEESEYINGVNIIDMSLIIGENQSKINSLAFLIKETRERIAETKKAAIHLAVKQEFLSCKSM